MVILCVNNMKKVVYVLSMLIITAPAIAETEPVMDKTRTLTTASYVEEGINTALSTYDSNTNPNGKFIESGSGAVVTGVNASNGTVTVTKSEVTIPVGNSSSNVRASIWLQ